MSEWLIRLGRFERCLVSRGGGDPLVVFYLCEYVGPRMNLGYLYSMTGQPDKTISELREVLQLEPKNTEALDKLARLLMTRGQFEGGIAVLEVAKSSQVLPAPLLVLLADAYVKK